MSRRVAHIVQRMAPGGLEVIVLELARQLPGRHLIISLEGSTGGLHANWLRLSTSAVDLHGLDKKPGLDLPLYQRLRSVIRRFEADAVVTHHAGPFVYGGPAARAAGVTRVVHVEHDVWHYQSPRRRHLMRAIAHIAKPTIVGVTEMMRQPLRELFPNRHIEIISNGVVVADQTDNRNTARAKLNVTADKRVIGAAGRLELVKGHDVLLEALALLPNDIVVALAGDGTMRAHLVDRARRLGLTDRVGFLGHRDDISSLYAGFDAFCQPSRNEGLPLAVLEAQAAGVPVVATLVGDLASALCPKSGVLVQPDNPTALARALASVLAGGRPSPSPSRFISERFNWTNTLGGYARLTGV
jgi:glycosyltransferase involved in cell wall biosynthesis